jgi:hypothetical protein
MEPKGDAKTKEEETAKAMRREDSYEKVVLNLWASNHRIARVAKSIREPGGIPPPIGRLRKMIPEVLDVV